MLLDPDITTLAANQAIQLNASEICNRYLYSLKDRQHINDTRNALVRYFVPSIGGPVPSAQKRRPISVEEVHKAFEFLVQVSLDSLANAPALSCKALEELDSSSSQRERVLKDLRGLVNWGRDLNYLPPPINPIPEGICNHIKLGVFKELLLKPANARQIFETFLPQVEEQVLETDLMNAIIRFFVPGCGGPLPVHKPALESETQAGLKFLEEVPLEYLNEAVEIAMAVLQALNCSETHGTRIRNALRALIDWARAEQYLPNPIFMAPWGGEVLTQVPGITQSLLADPVNIFEKYQDYCKHLERIGREKEVKPLQTAVIRYLVPVLGGPQPNHKRSTPIEIQQGLNYLKEVSPEEFLNSIEQIETTLERFKVEPSQYRSLCSRLRGWKQWIVEQDAPVREEILQLEFNTFYTNGVRKERKKPGRHLYENSCPVHALCAKRFPNDYINSKLQKQLDEYQKWRLANDVTPGSIENEDEQILQVMGWLHRYEHVGLEELCFERVITRSKLILLASEYQDYQQYWLAKEGSTQAAREQADQDIKRVERYLKFVGDNPSTQCRRIFIILCIAKFVYRDLLGSDDFPDDRDIPVLRRLLELQAKTKKRTKYTPQTVSYADTSVSWEEAITVMEQARQRVKQVVLPQRARSRKGYQLERRPDTAIAHALQVFLSVAFCLVIPSRARTFYELEIGRTFKAGILAKTKFITVQDLHDQGLWEERKHELRFYIHHTYKDSKTGKSMTPVMVENGGWWAEIPNLLFDDGAVSLYDYIERWLTWGRNVHGKVEHNYFFCQTHQPKPLKGGDWSHRIKTVFETYTGIPVPPKNIRKMFSCAFPEHAPAAAMLLEHSERMHTTNYDMRQTIDKVRPVMEANEQFIQNVLRQRSQSTSD